MRAVTVYAQKTRIVLQGRVRFGGAVIRSRSVVAGLWLKGRVEHPALTRVEHIPGAGYVHHFHPARPEDIDPALEALVAEAYVVGKGAPRSAC